MAVTMRTERPRQRRGIGKLWAVYANIVSDSWYLDPKYHIIQKPPYTRVGDYIYVNERLKLACGGRLNHGAYLSRISPGDTIRTNRYCQACIKVVMENANPPRRRTR